MCLQPKGPARSRTCPWVAAHCMIITGMASGTGTPRMGRLSLLGILCALAAITAILPVLLLTGSMSGVPGGTSEDYRKDCSAFLILGAVAALTLAGGLLSLIDWVRAPSKGHSRRAAGFALILNAAPWILAFGWEILGRRL